MNDLKLPTPNIPNTNNTTPGNQNQKLNQPSNVNPVTNSQSGANVQNASNTQIQKPKVQNPQKIPAQNELSQGANTQIKPPQSQAQTNLNNQNIQVDSNQATSPEQMNNLAAASSQQVQTGNQNTISAPNPNSKGNYKQSLADKVSGAKSPLKAETNTAKNQSQAPSLPQVGTQYQQMPPSSGVPTKELNELKENAKLSQQQAPQVSSNQSQTGSAKASLKENVAGLHNPEEKKPQKFEQPKNQKKFLMIGGIVVVVIVLLATVFFLMKSVLNKPDDQAGGDNETGVTSDQEVVNLVYWGLWEDEAVMNEVFAQYQEENPQVTIEYKKQSHRGYRERLQSAINEDNGPDIYRIHASWVPIFEQQMSVMPSDIMSVEEFSNTFYPVAVQQLIIKSQIKAIPLMYDGLALYYNKDIFRVANKQPPETWNDLVMLAKELSLPSDVGERSERNFQRAGLAIGNASNTEHFSDILALLIYQNGGNPLEPSSNEAKQAFNFYTKLYTQDKVWSSALPAATVAFAREDVAMMFAPSWKVHQLKEMNPNLNFGISEVPKLAQEKMTIANYWAEGVSSASTEQEQKEAWKLLKYLSSKDVQQQLYSLQKKTRTFGEIYSRMDLADQLIEDPYVGAFLKDAPYAKASFVNSATHDNAMNDMLIGYYRDTVNAIVEGGNTDEAFKNLSLAADQLKAQYQISQ